MPSRCQRRRFSATGTRASRAGTSRPGSAQTDYRWRKEYGGLGVDQARRLKELERENSWLKRLLADQALDNAILKEVASGASR